MLGLFLPIQAGGWSASRLPRSTSWTFDYNADLARTAEALGFDLVFALVQWLPKGGYGGVLDGTALDSFIPYSGRCIMGCRISGKVVEFPPGGRQRRWTELDERT